MTHLDLDSTYDDDDEIRQVPYIFNDDSAEELEDDDLPVSSFIDDSLLLDSMMEGGAGDQSKTSIAKF